jgi:hypothetical protein
MVLIEDWLPPTRGNWEVVVSLFSFFPVVRRSIHTSVQAHEDAGYAVTMGNTMVRSWENL